MTSLTFPATRWSLAGLLLLTLVSLSSVQAEKSHDGAKAELQTFELRIVDLKGDPVPEARMEIRSRPLLDSAEIVTGEFLKQDRNRVSANADTNGVLRVQGEPLPAGLSFSIEADGFAPFWIALDQKQVSVPPSLTASVEPAWTIGGVVLDPGGRPVPGAAVQPFIRYQKPPEHADASYIGTKITTDKEGRWHYGHVPESLSEVQVSITHPEYEPLRESLSRNQFESTAGNPSTGSITLTQGLTLAGIVRDPQGDPIEEATVRTKFLNEIREAKTDEFGRYQLTGCEEMHCRVVVFANERALEMREVHVQPGMEPVDFVLPPGGRVKVRVVDGEGKGLPRSRIFLQHWRGPVDYFEFDHVDCYTDENGVWEWNEAPLDAFEADICPPGGMQLVDQRLVAGKDEHLFQPPPLLVVTGRVLDAESGEPITNPRVTPGHRNDNPSIGVDWYERDAYTPETSHYRVQFNRSLKGYVVRVEAEGYRVSQSRDFHFDEGEVTFDFRMQRAESLTGQIVDASGRPASGAKLAISDHGSQISIQDGRFDDSSTYATRMVTDKEGRFSVPARDVPFHLVVIHDQGHALLFSESIPSDSPIALKPWASIKGTYRIGSKPAANLRLRIDLNRFQSDHPIAGRVYASATARTDEKGRYHHDRVFDETTIVAREIIMMINDGAKEIVSTPRIPIHLEPGEHRTLDIGGSGYVAVGQLKAPVENDKPINWKLASVHVSRHLIAPVPPVHRNALMQKPGQWEAWLRTPDGLGFLASSNAYERERSESIRYYATVGPDGLFQIDDIPAGEYELRANLGEGQKGAIPNHRFSVPRTGGTRAADAVDLGIIQLE